MSYFLSRLYTLVDENPNLEFVDDDHQEMYKELSKQLWNMLQNQYGGTHYEED